MAIALGLGPTSAYRQAMEKGFLEYLETQSWKRYKIFLGKIFPEDDPILPSPDEEKILWDARKNLSDIVQSQGIEIGEYND